MTPITSLTLQAGVPAHVTVADHANADMPLPNATISWSTFGASSIGLTITPDLAGGFTFLAATPGAGVEVTAHYSLGGVVINALALPVTVTASVQPVYLSP